MLNRDRCTEDAPCSDGHPERWIHAFEVVYEGELFDTLRCNACGYEVKVVPRERTLPQKKETP